MLINTVILFLRDALPVFVVMAILLSLLQQQSIKANWVYISGLLGMLLSFALLMATDVIAHAIDDTGREWFYASLYFGCYCLVLMLLSHLAVGNIINFSARSKTITRYSAITLVAVIIMLNGANFLIYFTGFWHKNNASNVLSTGVVLGVGICTSIAILLYFMMEAVQHYYRLIRETLLVFFSAGLLMQSTNLLLQIDELPIGNILWDSNNIVLENSEVGYLLTVFFGYDATPTLIQLLLYATAIVAAFTIIFIRSNSALRNGNRTLKEVAL